MLKCKNFENYKAIYPPRCNGGNPCEACKQKWESINRARARVEERRNKPSLKK